MNETEIRECLKDSKFRLIRIKRFQNHDRIAVENAECRLTWNMRGHIEDYNIADFKMMVKANE